MITMLGNFFRRAMSGCARDRKGNVATTFALTLVPLMTVLGMTVDFSRTESSSSQVQYALDGAVLAAAKAQTGNASDTKIKAAGKTYFDAALAANTVTANCSAPVFSLPKDTGSVEGKVTCKQPTTVSGIIGLNELEFTRESKTLFGVGKLDVVFMFDTSGSMGNDDRMDDLQKAAKSAAQTIFQTKTKDKEDIRIAVSTYATSVNVGSYFKAVTDEEPDQWDCERWKKKRGKWECKEWKQKTSTCVTGREGTQKYTDAAPGSGAWMDYETLSCNSATLTPLTSVQGKVISAIETLPTSGSTAGHLGIAWSWYLISPNWSSIWPEKSKPRAYDEPDSTKVAILMTDGEFNVDYMSGGDSFAHAKKFCDGMKADDIVIYTVAFKAPEKGEEILEYCATNSTLAFKASNGQQLDDAYKKIASNISDLRIIR